MSTIKKEKGFVPIIILVLVVVIGTSSYIAIKNLGLGPPQPNLEIPYQATSSAKLKSSSPKPSLKNSPSPTPKAPITSTPNPTSETSTNNNNSSNNANNTSQNANTQNSQSALTPTPTSTLSSTSQPTTNTSEPITVDKTSLDITISRAGKTLGFLYGPGIYITSNTASGYSIANDQAQSGVGLEYGSVGLQPGQTRYVATFITADKPNGVYTGTNTITYYDLQSKGYKGPTISYKITLTD